MARDIPSFLVYARKKPIFGWAAYYLLKLIGVEIPRSVSIGSNFELAHGGVGVVIHSRSIIGNRVKIYPGVTIGRADIHKSMDQSLFEGIQIEDDVILSPGVKVLGKKGVLKVATGTVVGANAVLLQTTGEWEIWAGIPASCVGTRSTTTP
jgi:serine O-acetyltransferase